MAPAYPAAMMHRNVFGRENTAFLYRDPAMSNSVDPVGLRQLRMMGVCVSDLLRHPDSASSLQTMVELLFFNPDFPENMTAYIPARDSPHAFTWEGVSGATGLECAWRRCNVMDMATRVMRAAADALYEARLHYDYDYEDVCYFRNNLYQDVHDTPPSLIRRIETIDTVANFSPMVRKPPPPAVSTPSPTAST